MFYTEQLVFPSAGRSNYRIPSLVVTGNGTALAFCVDRIGSVKDNAKEMDLVYAVKKPGKQWSDVRTLDHLDGWRIDIDSAVYDSEADKTILLFKRQPIALDEFGDYTPEEIAEHKQKEAELIQCAEEKGIFTGPCRMVCTDNGETFTEERHSVSPVMQPHLDGKEYEITGFAHGCSHGIQLRHGKYAGRLLLPARTFIGKYTDYEQIRKCAYNNAIYSDNHGLTWKTSNCVQIGTGEGTLIELGDGSILYNSRAYFADGKRYLAISHDGGETYGEFSTDDFLKEEKIIGCNASFLRLELSDITDTSVLPDDAKDFVIFCNPRSDIRQRMTACVSFDSGRTYHEAKVFYNGPCAYSSLDYDRNTGHFFLIYERGNPEKGRGPYNEGLFVAEFDLDWLLSK